MTAVGDSRRRRTSCTRCNLRRTFGKWHRLAGIPAEQLALLLRHTTYELAQTTYG